MNGFHGARYYRSADSLCQVVAVFLGCGLVSDEPALVIATARHRAAVRKFLRIASFSVDRLRQRRRLVMVDAAATLKAIMVHGTPDPVRFESVVGALVARVGDTGRHHTRVYDEMVDLLWKREQSRAALQLEALWDRLLGAHQCSLLCGHGPDEPGEPAQTLVARHSHVVAENGVAHPVMVTCSSG